MKFTIFLREDFKNFWPMFPRIRQYGFKYWYDREYREQIKKQIKNRKVTLNRRRAYGGGWNANAKRRKTTLFRKRGNICFWCGRKMRFSEATLDHIVPRSCGGSNHLENLRLIHNDCRIERDKCILDGIITIK